MMGMDEGKINQMYGEEIANALEGLIAAMEGRQAEGYDEAMDEMPEELAAPEPEMGGDASEAMDEMPGDEDLGQEVSDFFSGKDKAPEKSDGVAVMMSSSLTGKKPKKGRGRRKKGK